MNTPRSASSTHTDDNFLQGDEILADTGRLNPELYTKEEEELERQATVQECKTKGVKSHRVLGRWQTALIFITNEVGLGVLSLPAALHTLGLIPGIIAIAGMGILCGYTAYVLLQFYRRYPEIVNIADCGRKIGGKWLEAFVGVAFVINLCLTSASAGLTISIALNTMTGHGLCTVAFIAFSIIACWALCIPRSLGFVAQIGIPSTISIVVAVLIVMISIGVGGPRIPPVVVDKTIDIALVGSPSFAKGMVACLNIAFAYAGNQGFVTVMAEMKDPSRDFTPALLYLQSFAIIIYTIVAVVIYVLAGQFTTSPALGAAPVVAAKIAYGIVFPCLLGTGLVFGHTGIKYLFVLSMRRLGAVHEVSSNTRRSWIVWLVNGTVFWIIAFVLANSIPVFSSMLSVSSAVFVSWFTFGLSGLIWLHLNWNRQLKGKRKIALAIVNWGVIGIALLMNTGGMYAAIIELLDVFNDPNGTISGPFTCGDNGIFMKE